MKCSGIFETLRRLAGAFAGRRVHYVTDDSRWSFSWDARYIVDELRARRVPAVVCRDVSGLKNQVLHFGDRYALLRLPQDAVDASNRLFLTWFHGSPDDPDHAMQEQFRRLAGWISRVERVVVPCRITRNDLERAGIDRTRIASIPLGVDTKLFRPPGKEQKDTVRRQLGIPGNAFCIGSFQKDGVGWGDGNEPKLIKGPDVFLDAIAGLARRCPSLFVLLTGPARGYVKEGLNRAGVSFLHRCLDDYRDIGRYYHALDAYIISSRCEGGPKALLESWASGVPVISTRVGMAADLIRHRENGMLADTGDAAALGGYAAELAGDPGLRERIARNALLLSRDYSWQNIAGRYYQDLYRPCFP